MTNESGGVAGSDDGGGSLTRVGTAERGKAVALLTEHWQAGRLDPGEHERRVTRAREAVTGLTWTPFLPICHRLDLLRYRPRR
jgi:Domain of unknown function (DUF1707)